MKIHLIVKDVRYECEAEFEVTPFRDLNEAKARFQEMCKMYRDDAMNDGWIIDEDTDVAFEAYELGYECQNHYYFNILTQEI